MAALSGRSRRYRAAWVVPVKEDGAESLSTCGNEEEISTTRCVTDYLLEIRKRCQEVYLTLDVKIRGHVDMSRSKIFNAWSTGERQMGSIGVYRSQCRL